jgi:predicted RNA-binding Zn-ribbon protein involved in translation (DUF1610 family)
MTTSAKASSFPCPVCSIPREVKITKKQKPYITCDSCGIQLFVRGPVGVASFNRLLDRAHRDGRWTTIADIEHRYQKTCSKGHKFWIEPQQIKTSVFDGSFQGFRCPQKGCGEIVPWETKR